MALLTFIEKHFTKYFSQDSEIPSAYFHSSKSTLKYKLLKIQEISNKKNLDSKLFKIINYHMKSFIDSPKGASYRELIYCKTFLQEIYNILNSSLTGLKLEKQLITNLIYLNFNVYALYNYIAKRIIQHYQSKSTYQKQLIVLQLFKKLINQSQIKPQFAFKSGVESLKKSLSIWIEEEIKYHQERRQLTIQFQESSNLKNRANKSNEKIYCNLSVAQLAYFMKLMANAKVITPQNISMLVDFISNNFSTSSQSEISKKSLRNKIYSPETGTIENVQEVMESLIDEAEKDKALD